MAFKSVKNSLQRISAILESSTYKYSEIFFTSSPKIQAKKEHLFLRPGKSIFRTPAGSSLLHSRVLKEQYVHRKLIE